MTKWLGSEPKKCDLCQKAFKKVFYDARTKWGPWGIVCSHCFETECFGLGTGNGQKYNLKTREKVAG